MEKAILFIILILTVQLLPAQSQLENCYFAAWQDLPSTLAPAGVYQEPVGNTWATSNEASMMFLAQPSVKKTSDSYLGEFAAMIQTVQIGEKNGSGTLFTGKFTLDIVHPLKSTKFGIPFTDRPVYLKGFYKYLPVANDSCRMASYLTKWNTGTKKRDTIAAASISRQQSMTTVSSYTEFNLIYKYYSGQNPDSITLIFASSADGANFNAAVGSTLYIDEISLEYFPVAAENIGSMEQVLLYPNPVTNYLIISSNQTIKANRLNIYSPNGTLIRSIALKNNKEKIDVTDLPGGLYLYHLDKQDGSRESGKFIKK